MYVRDYAPGILQSFFQQGEPRVDFEQVIEKEANMMKEYMQTSTNVRNAKDVVPQLPELEKVQQPPNFGNMSWQQVREYIEKGHQSGSTDPYPAKYPEHLKWSTFVVAPASDVTLARTLQEKEFMVEPMDGPTAISPTMPVDDDAFHEG